MGKGVRAVRDERVLVRGGQLRKHFPYSKGIFGKPSGYVQAVSDVDITVYKGETFGLVGESGCGKSTLGRLLIRLLEPSAGKVFYRDVEITGLKSEALRQMRRKMQIIFQDPYASLNPRMTVFENIVASLNAFHMGARSEKEQKVLKIMNDVSIAHHLMHRYPHEFSGGQRQRMVIARALVLNPEFVVCDEPVSALDVSVRSQVLNLMIELQKEYALTYFFISHDLSVIRHICTRVAVMYLGKIVELADSEALFDRPLHPYTSALLSAIPVPDAEKKAERIILQGDVPSPLNPPSGCRFHTRCRYKTERCETEEPELRQAADGHMAACHLCEGQ
jgi:peptide/nickel transport system ATP-binding protein/oligopeptide transport system ATP-binding protein